VKLVLDTNVVVSALLSPRNPPAKILGLVLSGSAGIALDNGILAEYVDVLNRDKFEFDKDLVKTVLDYMAKEGEYIISAPQKIKLIDEGDRMFYELYKDKSVDFLITGNKKHFPGESNILTPRKFMEKIILGV
jgi:putative PIN family toxin of toxin-antitoxin system